MNDVVERPRCIPIWRRTPRGLTLAEVIVVVFVFSLLTLTCTKIMIGGMDAWQKGQVRMKLRSDGRYAIDTFIADFRQCSQTSVPGGNNFITNGGLTCEFNRFDNTGTGTTYEVEYQITTSYTVTRTNVTSGQIVVLAQNVIPVNSAQGSYFYWADGNYTRMGIQLTLVNQAYINQTINLGFNEDYIQLSSSAYYPGSQYINDSSHGFPFTGVAEPSDLADPRGPLRMRFNP